MTADVHSQELARVPDLRIIARYTDDPRTTHFFPPEKVQFDPPLMKELKERVFASLARMPGYVSWGLKPTEIRLEPSDNLTNVRITLPNGATTIAARLDDPGAADACASSIAREGLELAWSIILNPVGLLFVVPEVAEDQRLRGLNRSAAPLQSEELGRQVLPFLYEAGRLQHLFSIGDLSEPILPFWPPTLYQGEQKSGPKLYEFYGFETLVREFRRNICEELKCKQASGTLKKG